MLDIMLDLETLGTRPGSVILSIGAVAFDPKTGELGAEFHERVSVESSGSTVGWWLKQSDAARAGIAPSFEGGLSIKDALLQFDLYLYRVGLDDTKMWGNGASFDNALLSDAYAICGVKQVWKFYNDRCYRTLKNLYPEIKMERTGTHHDALDDARSQALHACAIFKHMRTLTRRYRDSVSEE
jgi:hypothetical protein